MITHIHFLGHKEGYKPMNMYINYCIEREQLSFQVNMRPFPTPNHSANGWFTFSKEETKTLMKQLEEIHMEKWKRKYGKKEPYRFPNYEILYVVDDEKEYKTFLYKEEPPRFNEFLDFINSLYPIKENEEFIWKEGYYNQM